MADTKAIKASTIGAGHAVQQPRSARDDLRETRWLEAASRRRMAALTVVCLVALLLGWVGEATHVVPTSIFLALYCASYASGGFYATSRAWRELRSGTLNVDLLMVLAAAGAAAVGEWPEGAVLLFLFSLSNTLEEFVLGRTRRAVEALMDLTPEAATVRRDGVEQRVAVEELRLDDVVIVRPGERIPADGTLLSGHTSVDQAPVTGESMPVEKAIGDVLFAATLNGSGAIEVRVTKLASESTLSRIVRLVEQAQSEKAESQRFTDWFGQRYTMGVLVAAMLIIALPMLFLEEAFDVAFYRAMTVLVVASPCAVVISIPAAIMSAITSAARGGVLFKGGAHLERAATLRAIAFDKTGTLTVGRPQLVDLMAASGTSEDEVLQLAASAESLSEHPLARAVVEAAQKRGLELLPASDMEALIGRGLQARVGKRSILIGKPGLWPENGAISEQLQATAGRLMREGKTTVFVGDATQVIGVLAIADTLRPSAPAAIQQLKVLGIEHIAMLTGDNKAVAAAISEKLGIGYEAELLPEDKLRAIQGLRERYGDVAMVGDGINDAPGLAAASMGISLGGTGTDVALETADVVLMADDLRHLPYAIGLARAARRIIVQNIVFAFAMMAMLLTAIFFGSLRLPFAVLGHEGSTVLVILNGLRLLAFPRPVSDLSTTKSITPQST